MRKLNLSDISRTVIRSILGVGMLMVASALPSAAQNLAGSWKITFFLEPGHSTGATQCIVFTQTGGIVGEPKSGTWVAPSFPGWKGQWIQEGDHFRFYGFTGSLATAEFGALVSNNILGGEFAHFISPNGTTSTAGSFSGARTTSCGSSVAPPTGQDPSGLPTQ